MMHPTDLCGHTHIHTHAHTKIGESMCMDISAMVKPTDLARNSHPHTHACTRTHAWDEQASLYMHAQLDSHILPTANVCRHAYAWQRRGSVFLCVCVCVCVCVLTTCPQQLCNPSDPE